MGVFHLQYNLLIYIIGLLDEDLVYIGIHIEIVHIRYGEWLIEHKRVKHEIETLLNYSNISILNFLVFWLKMPRWWLIIIYGAPQFNSSTQLQCKWKKLFNVQLSATFRPTGIVCEMNQNSQTLGIIDGKICEPPFPPPKKKKEKKKKPSKLYFKLTHFPFHSQEQWRRTSQYHIYMEKMFRIAETLHDLAKVYNSPWKQ